MTEFVKKDLKNQKIPESSGVFIFSDSHKNLFIRKASNLKKTLDILLTKKLENKVIFKMISLTKTISYKKTSTLFEALVKEKTYLNKENPEFNQQIKPYEDYVYLGIDSNRVPFFNVTENTQNNLYYIGPFQDRFFLFDLIDTFGTVFGFPACEEKNYPCIRLKVNKCSGWCVEENRKIREIIRESYLQPNETVINKIKKKQEKLFDTLQFEKAEILKKQEEIILKYYDFLEFFHVTKNVNINFSENKITFEIKNGMLLKVVKDGKQTYFPEVNIEYRDNEYLAHEKNQFTERWIIYQHLKKNKLEKINEILKKSVLKINEGI
ncbi:MAG: hypothetical protein HQ534_05850 [Armatimonadetes bacterium]|nr:hypothetical protein [Armatimonadota bacterium]